MHMTTCVRAHVTTSHHLQVVQLAGSCTGNNLGAMLSDTLQRAWGIEGAALLEAQRAAIPGRLFSLLADRDRIALALL